MERIRRGERVEHYDTIRQRKDGTLIDISLTISPLRDPAGKIIGASKIARDITERRRAEDQQRLLLREMDHRVKNLFALAGGVVGLSARSATTPQALSSAVRDRLAALAKAHALTLRPFSENNQSTQKSTTLHALIETILSPHDGRTDDGGPRVVISGPDIPIGGGSVMSLALLLHEFATNAVKYGALSSSAGAVAIECSEDDGRFALTWTERGGPPVERPVRRRRLWRPADPRDDQGSARRRDFTRLEPGRPDNTSLLRQGSGHRELSGSGQRNLASLGG